MTPFRETHYTVRCGVKKRLTFALVADLHAEPHEPVVEAVARHGVDFTAISGDLVNRMHLQYEKVGPVLGAFAAAGLTFYVSGNHDIPQNPRDEETARSSGAVYFDNSGGVFEINGCRLNIGGLSTLYDTHWLEKFSSRDGFKLLLCHHPEYYPELIRRTNVDLTVSGHAHGGQWCFFGQGIYAPGQGLFPKYTHGVYENRLVVSRGLCNNAGVPRIFTPLEIVYVTLEPDGGKSGGIMEGS